MHLFLSLLAKDLLEAACYHCFVLPLAPQILATAGDCVAILYRLFRLCSQWITSWIAFKRLRVVVLHRAEWNMLITILDELRQWLAGLKQERLADKFIGGGWLGDKLLTLTREDLADLGVPKEQRGHLMLAVEALRQGEGRVTLPDEHAPSYAPQFTE